MLLNVRSADLHSCIAFESRQVFKRIFYLKQIIVITGAPSSGEPGAIDPITLPLIRPSAT